MIAVIAVSLAFVIGVDIRGARSAEQSADQILNDAARSIELVDDVRWQIHRLGHATRDGVPEILASIDRDIAGYAPLATYKNEATEWAKVHEAISLAREAAQRGDFERVREVTSTIGPDTDRLVAINHNEAVSYLTKLRDERTLELIGDIVAVAIAGSVLTLLARALFRAQAENLSKTEERNRELDAFAGRAAHDLRGPLNPIRGYAEMISIDTSASPDTRRQASQIVKGVLRMTRVIDDMLALSRAGHPEAGETAVAPTLATIRDELAAELQDIQITIDVADHLVVACSEGTLEQVLRNLIGNAAKYRAQDRPLEISITGRRQAGSVQLEVADNGLGMDEETRLHAFDPFYRGRRDIAGTGLGLSIVERLVRSNGGSCELHANAPGTRVVVRLPARI